MDCDRVNWLVWNAVRGAPVMVNKSQRIVYHYKPDYHIITNTSGANIATTRTINRLTHSIPLE